MTDFLQELANKGVAVTAVPVHGGWIEIDSMRDFARYSEEVKEIL